MFPSVSTSSAEVYTALNVRVQEGLFLSLLSQLSIAPNFKCLDIGCGSGSSTVKLADKLSDDGHVTGIDPDTVRIALAKQQFQRKNVDYLLARSVELPSCESGYDLVVSNCVMHWINYDEKLETYRQILKVLKRGGIFASCEVSRLPEQVTGILSFAPEEVRNQARLHMITEEKNKEIFHELDFEIVKIEEVVEERTFQSIDTFFDLFSATFHGKIDVKKMYYDNCHQINLQLNEDSSITMRAPFNYIIVKKK